MSGFTQAVLRYRWELWLFVGVPLVVSVTWVIESSRPEPFTLPLSEHQDLPYISPKAILLLLLLGLSYLRVRRLGRPTLALVWAYGVAAALANAVATVAIQVFGTPLPGSRTALSLVASAVALAILVWFGRQASRISLGHALLLVGLSTTLPRGINPLTSVSSILTAVDEPYRIVTWSIVLAFSIALSLLAVWALGRFDSASGVARTRMVIALFSVAVLVLISTHWAIVSWQSESLQPAFTSALVSAIFAVSYAVVIALIYVLRVRTPRERESAG